MIQIVALEGTGSTSSTRGYYGHHILVIILWPLFQQLKTKKTLIFLIYTNFVYYYPTMTKTCGIILHLIKCFLLISWGYRRYRILATILVSTLKCCFLIWIHVNLTNTYTKNIGFKKQSNISSNMLHIQFNFSNKKSYFGAKGSKIPFCIMWHNVVC